ncbi:hypothetical protein FQN60_012555, partial [Etheostoma spectabile]
MVLFGADDEVLGALLQVDSIPAASVRQEEPRLTHYDSCLLTWTTRAHVTLRAAADVVPADLSERLFVLSGSVDSHQGWLEEAHFEVLLKPEDQDLWLFVKHLRGQ